MYCMRLHKDYTLSEEACLKLEIASRLLRMNRSAIIDKLIKENLEIDEAKEKINQLEKEIVEIQKIILKS